MSGSFIKARIAELPSSLGRDNPGGVELPTGDVTTGGQGQGWAYALGKQQDDEQALLTGSVLLRYPPRTSDDALAFLGADSAIEQFAGEPAGTLVPPTGYRARLNARWSTWKKAGSAQAIIDSLNAYGFPDVAVYQDFDGHFQPGEWYSRFWVVLGPDFGTLGILPLTMPFELGYPVTLGTTATIQQVVAAKRQILKWKSAHSYPVRVIILFGAENLLGVYSYDGNQHSPMVMPFTLPYIGFGVPNALSLGYGIFWNIGKLMNMNSNMPFTLGGFIL